MTPTILEAIDDQNLLGSRVTASASWKPWRAVLAAIFALGMDAEALALYHASTGRSEVPAACDTAWLCCGRRAGKSYALALVGVYLACFKDYRPHLAHGERATVMIIATDRRQSRVIFRYIRGLLRHSEMLSQMVQRETSDEFDLTNAVTIEVATASHRTIRGYSIAACLCDEIAFWPTETAAASDEDILAAIRPAMATIPGSKLICASSPYAKRGAMWAAYKRFFAQPDASVLVWQAASKVMNSTIPQSFLDRQFELDPVSAEAEYNAQFRSDIEAFIDRAAIEKVVAPGRRELAPMPNRFRHFGFVDPSGGGQDSYCLAIAHLEGEAVVLDCLREVKPPLDPAVTTGELAAVARSYGLSAAAGDRYGGQWPAEVWRSHGIAYQFSEKSKSDLYGELLPLINAGKVELLDNQRLVNQLCALERRTTRGSGHPVIDHPVGPKYHDDVANVCAGVCATATRTPAGLATGSYGYGGYATVLRGSDWRNGLPPPPGPWRAPTPPPVARLVPLGWEQPADPFPRSKSGGVLLGTF